MFGQQASAVPIYLNGERLKSPQLPNKFKTNFISAVRPDSIRIASSNHAQKWYVLG